MQPMSDATSRPPIPPTPNDAGPRGRLLADPGQRAQLAQLVRESIANPGDRVAAQMDHLAVATPVEEWVRTLERLPTLSLSASAESVVIYGALMALERASSPTADATSQASAGALAEAIFAAVPGMLAKKHNDVMGLIRLIR